MYYWLYDCVNVSYIVIFLLFVCLWHVPHPIVLWLSRIYGMYICMYNIHQVSLWWIKWPRWGVEQPPLSSAEVEVRAELYLHSSSRPSRPVLGWNLTFTLFTCIWCHEMASYRWRVLHEFCKLRAHQERLSNYFNDEDRSAAVWNNVGLEGFTAI